MNYDSIIELNKIKQVFNGWTYLDIPKLNIPKGFSIALIGENGAGKSTMLKIIAGILNEYSGKIHYFNGEKKSKTIRNNIGYTGTNNYFSDNWTINDIANVNKLSYDNFSVDTFKSLCEEFDITDTKKKFASFSDGMKMKIALASIFARDCQLLLLDEPSSPLDPLMREKLCTKMQEYIAEGNGEKSIIFSTHNITDMEHIADYAIIMASGKIEEFASVEELKEKYVYVRGHGNTYSAEKYLINFNDSQYGYEGLCLASNIDKFNSDDINVETPTLSQISVSIINKAYNPLTNR